MQVTELESQGLKRNFKITVEAASLQQQMEEELKRAGEMVKIPGFRPGFIPMKVLQQRYGKSVQADVIKQSINRSTNEAMSQRNLRPAMTPQITIDNYKEGDDLSYTLSFEAFPEVPEVKFQDITLDRNVFEVEESKIEEAAQKIAERNPSLVRAKDGSKAQLGNVVTIDFKGKMEGKLFDGGSADNFKLELGSGQFIEGFEGQLVGLKEGEEKLVKVKFPDQYQASHLAGKDATFDVTIKEIAIKETPKLDDEFAKLCGFADIKAFKDAVRAQTTKEYDQIVRRQLKKELFDQLEETVDFALPQGMVEQEFTSIWQRLEQAKADGDESLKGKSEDELKEEYQAIAERRVKLGILLADVGTRNNLQVSREELGRAVMQQASMFPGQEKKVMEFYRNNPERMDDMRGPLLEEKAVDFILTKVKFNDSKISIDELVASNRDDEEDDTGENKTGKSSDEKKAKKDAKEKTVGKKKSASA